MNTDCLLEINELSGFIGSHNGRCARGVESPEVHLAPEYHIRLGGFCGNICASCLEEMSKRRDFKEAIVRELTAEGN